MSDPSKKRWNKVIDNANFSLRLNPRNKVAFYARGMANHKIGKCKEALQDLNRAIDLDEDYANAYHYRGIVKKSCDFEKEALEDFARAIKLDPNVEKWVKDDENI